MTTLNNVSPKDILVTGPSNATTRFIFAHGAGAPMTHDWMELVTAKLVDKNIEVVRFRHAEAGWGGHTSGDKDRQLSDVGHLSSKTMGEWFKAQGYTLDLILCSTAVRAKETLQGFLKGAGQDPKIKYRENLYLAPPETIIEALSEGNDAYKNIMIIGHNPGIHQVVFDMASDNLSAVDTELTTSYPPAGLTGFKNSSTNSPLRKENLNFQFFMHPRKI